MGFQMSHGHVTGIGNVATFDYYFDHSTHGTVATGILLQIANPHECSMMPYRIEYA